jgi:hypothetical protein
MDAEELFLSSLQSNKAPPSLVPGLSRRASNILRHHGFVIPIDITKLQALILSGDVWTFKGVGTTLVREYCKYVAEHS